MDHFDVEQHRQFRAPPHSHQLATAQRLPLGQRANFAGLQLALSHPHETRTLLIVGGGIEQGHILAAPI
jgi:hypothetical protein